MSIIKKGLTVITMAAILLLIASFAAISTFAAPCAEFEYKFDNNNNVVLTGFKGDPVSLTLPSEIEGKKVVGIALSFMSGHNNTKEIYIPESVNNIARNVFASYNDITIYCRQDSYAQVFSELKNIPFCIIDDSFETGIVSSVKDDNIALAKGKSIELHAAVFPDYNSEDIEYTSSSPEIASVDNGVITALENGSCDVTVKAGELTRVYNVNVYTAVKTVDADKTIVMGVGERYSMNVKTAPSDADLSRLKYTVSNSSILVLNNNVITAKKTGSAQVRTWYNGQVMSITNVTVKESPASVRFEKDEITTGAGEAVKIVLLTSNNGASMQYTYSTSDDTVAAVKTIGSSKYIQTKKTGSAVITAVSYNGKIARCKVNVKKSPSSVKINVQEVTVDLGKTTNVKALLGSGAASYSLSYYSWNPSVATIDKNGKITGISSGKTTVAVRTFNGLKATCVVNVSYPKKVYLNKTEVTVGAGEKYQLISYVDDGITEFNKTFTSSDSSIASVDNKGNVTGKKVGQVNITVKTSNGKTAVCKFIVKTAPTSIKLGKNKMILQVGETYTLYSSVNGSAASAIRTFTVGDKSIADITGWNGTVKAKKAGTTKITVKTYNGKTDVCELKVVKTSVRKKIVDTAEAWLGYNESDGSYKEIFDVYNKGRIPGTYYMQGLDPWCAAYASAVFMKAGYVDLIYPNCSCPMLITGAQSMGIWQEKDDYVPERGDMILYSWADSGVGDCTTGAYHVGIVTDVNSGTIKVIEGNHDERNDINGDDYVGYRKIQVNGRFIRGFVTPKFPE